MNPHRPTPGRPAPAGFMLPAAILLLGWVLSACTPPPATATPALPATGEPRTTEAPSPATETPTATVTPTETPTPLPSVQGRDCGVDSAITLIAAGIEQAVTRPVLAAADLPTPFGEIPAAEAAGQVGFEVGRILGAANVGDFDRVVIPEYVSVSDVLAYLGAAGADDLPFEIVNYAPGMDMRGALLVAVHAGRAGWATGVWKDPAAVQREDESFYVRGLLQYFRQKDDGTFKLVTIPAQQIDGQAADIAITLCGAQVVRVGMPGGLDVVSVWSSEESGWVMGDGAVEEPVEAVELDPDDPYSVVVPEGVDPLANPPEFPEDFDYSVYQFDEGEVSRLVAVGPDSELIKPHPDYEKLVQDMLNQGYVLYFDARADENGETVLGKLKMVFNVENGKMEHAQLSEYEDPDTGFLAKVMLISSDEIRTDFKHKDIYRLKDEEDRAAKLLLETLKLNNFWFNHNEEAIEFMLNGPRGPSWDIQKMRNFINTAKIRFKQDVESGAINERGIQINPRVDKMYPENNSLTMVIRIVPEEKQGAFTGRVGPFRGIREFRVDASVAGLILGEQRGMPIGGSSLRSFDAYDPITQALVGIMVFGTDNSIYIKKETNELFYHSGEGSLGSQILPQICPEVASSIEALPLWDDRPRKPGIPHSRKGYNRNGTFSCVSELR